MKVQISDRAALESLTAAGLRTYLEADGWSDAGHWGERPIVIYSKEQDARKWEVLVPLRATASDYGEMMGLAVTTLAEAEDRSQLDVFNDLAEVVSDTNPKYSRKGNEGGTITSGLGRLERVDLRKEWKTEAQDFTPWLTQPENLAVLSQTLNMDLETAGQEESVGPFRADILCRSTDDDSWVLIENQLERTDHTHLGQLLTYAAGLKTVTIVWVAATFTDQHRAALDWLNEITDERFRFFGLEVELWRIGNSPAAPKFNIVAKPNEWVRAVNQTTRHPRVIDFTERNLGIVQMRLEGKSVSEVADHYGLGNQRVSDIYGAVKRMALGEAYGQFTKAAGVSQEMTDYIVAAIGGGEMFDS